MKTDPFAVLAEMRPGVAARAWSLDDYTWGDTDWMAARRKKGPPLNDAIAVYEVHDEGNTSEELHFLERLDKLSPLNVDRKVDIGAGYIKLGDPEKAKICFDQAVRIATKEALDAVSRVTQAIAVRCMMGIAKSLPQKIFYYSR